MKPDDIIAWRESQNMTQRDLATLLDVSHSVVARWEAGQEIIGPAKKLLALLIQGVPPFATDTDAHADAVERKHLLPAKLNFEDWEALEAQARDDGFRTLRDYVQHWLKAKAAEIRKGKG